MIPERTWTDRPLNEGETKEAAGLTLHRAKTPKACLVSGDLDAALKDLCPSAETVGLYQLRRDVDGIRIARDRALLVEVTGDAGWHKEYALSPASGLYARFDLSGPALDDVLAEGTSADLGMGSPSAAVQFAGLTCLLTRSSHGAELWVEAAFATYMTSWLLGRQ